MLALFRCRMRNLTGCSAKLDGLIDNCDLSKRTVMHRGSHAEMLDLRSAKTSSMRLMGPHGTPALFSIAIKSLLERRLVTSEMASFRASRFVERDASSAKRGFWSRWARSSVWQKRLKICLPDAAILMWPSRVGNTPVGMLVGWSLPAWPGTSFAISQRAAWKSRSEICAPSSDDWTH